MISKAEIARNALKDALKFRLKNGGILTNPIDIFQFATKLGIEVRFVDYPSLEAMYIKDNPHRIIISSQRPNGRQVFDCAHELGHFYYGHGSKIDEFQNTDSKINKFDPEEFAADCFAGYLLMPKTLVEYAFTQRNLEIANCRDLDIYSIANWIGVGYNTLLFHMTTSLKLISFEKAKKLQLSTPKDIRERFIPNADNNSLIVVDYNWIGCAIDAQVGDYLLLPPEVLLAEKTATMFDKNSERIIFRAVKPGIGRFYSSCPPWAAYLRVSRKGYTGRSIFRHLEDAEYV
ncbi:MAG: ImmA/IrrE family metallo-endopeptidase [Anaerolineaceae bacterium]|jgi:Zn-dependent peptidase ImmA (M78 family)